MKQRFLRTLITAAVTFLSPLPVVAETNAPAPMTDIAVGGLSRTVALLRRDLANQAEDLAQRFQDDIDPTLLLQIDLESEIAELMTRAVATFSCLRDPAWKIGFFDPITNIWLVAEVDETGLRDVRLGAGVARDGGASAWWPFLSGDGRTPDQAIALSTLLQLTDFGRVFPDSGCAPLHDMAARYSAQAAATQWAGIALDWPRPAAQLAAPLQALLARELGEDAAAGWQPWRTILADDQRSWVIPYFHANRPGAALLTHWAGDANGQSRLQAITPVAFAGQMMEAPE